MSVNTVGARSPIPGFASLLGGAILTFLFLIVATSEFGWLLGMPIQGFVLPTAFVGSCLVTGWGARIYFRRPFRVTLVVAALLVLLVAASAWISLAFYDVSFDGQAYHQEGVYQLAHGWNPLFTRHISPISSDQNVKLNHFPKGPWIIAAAMYRLTGRIETGKFANILLVCAAFSMALAVFAGSRKKLSAWPVAMAVLVAANPVALCQVCTFYVDGQMASLLACLAALCFLSVGRRQSVGEPVAVGSRRFDHPGKVHRFGVRHDPSCRIHCFAGVAEATLAEAFIHGFAGAGARDVRLRDESLCVQYPRERPPVLSFFRKRRVSESSP